MTTNLKDIAQQIHLQGGRAFLVGGAVRDQFLGLSPKDLDVEVFGLSSEALTNLLSVFGKVDLVGAAFGVIKLTTPDGQDFDFTLPRRENKTGRGHKGFQVEVDHTLTPLEAASRRDFTFNAVSQDILSGEVFDPFHGKDHLLSGVLEATSEAFSEDPLRVLRGFQFASRFNLQATDNLLQTCQQIVGEFHTLPCERVVEEVKKWALKGASLSAGLRFLRDSGWLSPFPELSALQGVPQDAEWHPEGDVWEHTLQVCDAAQRIAVREELSSEDRLLLVMAALCHDLGKVATTVQNEAGRWTAPAHAEEGVAPTLSLLCRMGFASDFAKRVSVLVREHMVHLVPEVTDRMVRRLLVRLSEAGVSLQVLVHLMEADHSGRSPLPAVCPEMAQELLRVAEKVGGEVKPLVLGRHLMEFMQPGPEMGRVLKALFERQLDGEFFTVEEGLSLFHRLKN